MSRRGLVRVDVDIAYPVHLQVSDQIQAMIERGELPAGMRLPTVRQLARDLDIAPNTVMRAYGSLREAGFIVSDGQRGTRVASNTPRASRSKDDWLRSSIIRTVESLQYRGYSNDQIAAALTASVAELRQSTQR